MRARPHICNQEGLGKICESIDAKGNFDEGWLQEILRKNPELLPVTEIEPIFYPLVPIGREVITKNGVIDNLFISTRGYPVLVETKLWKNPEAKREVLAQAIDYGSSLAKWNYEQINSAVRQYTKRYENRSMDLVDWIEAKYGPIEGSRDYFVDTVARNLRLGRFLTLIVGDRIRKSLVDTLDHINKYPHLAMDVALVELQIYRISENSNGDQLLIVPNLVAKTEITERSIVQISIEKDGGHKIDVKQDKAKKNEKKISLTEEVFWEILKRDHPKEYDIAKSLINNYKQQENIVIEPADASIVAKLNLNDTGYRASVFFISKNGNLGVWPRAISVQLEKAGLEKKMAEIYGSEIKSIFKMPTHKVELSCPLKKIDLDNFKSVVNSFMKNLELANSEF